MRSRWSWDIGEYLLPAGMAAVAVALAAQGGEPRVPPLYWPLFGVAAPWLFTWSFRTGRPRRGEFTAFMLVAGACAFLGPDRTDALVLLAGGAGTVFSRAERMSRAVTAVLIALLLSEAFTLRLAGTAVSPAQLGERILEDYIFIFAIVFASRQRRLRHRETERLLRQLEGEHAALEAAHAELQAYASHAAELAASEERNRLAREIHDVLAHTLTVIIVQADAASVRLQRDAAGAAESVQTVARLARQALQEARLSVAAIRGDPGTAGVDALRRLCDDAGRLAGMRCELRVAGAERPLPAPVALAAFRIAQEALTNARRHGRAQRAEVALAFAGDLVRLTVRDDGRGGGPGEDGGGSGLRGMAERAQGLGGTLQAGVGPDGRGYIVSAELPLGANRTAVGAPS
ncbi:MAG TPA: histidine kinase [Bacillota bacterium]|nr:histidine kinase [Bacillota bacterium]